ncbi:MAG: winged helix-turn-helix domain-containing protein [Methylobacteriaceae bacterium]|nr:winged helix-turn-helix domain-containing protein [Methylobacteriaceae bacterium]
MMLTATEDQAAPSGTRDFSFAPFRLFPERRLLLEGDKPVRLGSRALDILTCLVERAGQVVSKQELIAHVWPNVFVEESNLKIQVSALRRVLGHGHDGRRYIVAVTGRGYEFVAPVGMAEEARGPASQLAVTPGKHNLPVALTRVIGRADAIAAVAERMRQERLVTIVGPGGIGKTTLALAGTETVIAAYPDGVWFVDLAPLDDPRFVASAIARVLGVEVRSESPLPELIASLRDQRILLVLDNCEHVIDAAADAIGKFLKAVTGVRVLATSREPLGIPGECLFRLPALENPPPSSNLTAAEAMRFPAVQLFLERTSAVAEDFVLSDNDAPLVAQICRRLDGLPLAIELAAAHMGTFGIGGLSGLVSNPLRLPRTRRRATVPRHHTINAALDWSYGSLDDDERKFLRRLSIFVGSFTAEAASVVVTDATKPDADAIDRLAELASKSLVTTDLGDSEPRFRLLETTRAYALDKLDESGERGRMARCHAEYLSNLLERAGSEAEARRSTRVLASHPRQIDDVRAALDWAFSPKGDASVGVALTAAAVPLWVHVSLFEECRTRIEQALACSAGGSGLDPDREMRLLAALGIAVFFIRGGADDNVGRAFARALRIAERLKSVEYQLRSLWGLWYYHMDIGKPHVALGFAEKVRTVAESGFEAQDLLIGESMIGVSSHIMGDQPTARRHLELGVPRSLAADARSDLVRFPFDPGIMALVFLSRTQWLLGLPEMAMQTARDGVEKALTAGKAENTCFALALAACPIAIWTGDLGAAEQYVEMLLDQATACGLAVWNIWGCCHQGVLVVKRGDTRTGLQPLLAGLQQARRPVSATRSFTFLPTMAEALGQLGRIDEALAAVDEAIGRSERTELCWRMSDLLRVRAELLLLQNAAGAAATAEDLLRRALDWARRQGALAWELRAATSLARLLRDSGRVGPGRSLLQPVYERFTQGFETEDLRTARALLETI